MFINHFIIRVFFNPKIIITYHTKKFNIDYNLKKLKSFLVLLKQNLKSVNLHLKFYTIISIIILGG